jgi:hypothetical protein
MNNHIIEYKLPKSKYNVIEPHYMEDTTPDVPVFISVQIHVIL